MTQLSPNNSHRRQPELDIAKGFAILFMVWVHIFDELQPMGEGIGYILVEVLGGPFSAPVFMVCMGIGMDFSRHNRPTDLCRRGATLLGIGFILNLLRYVLPNLMKYAITGDAVWLKAMSSVFSVDILQFAGLAFFVIALMKKLSLKNWQMLITALGCSLLGTLTIGRSSGSEVFDYVLGFFIGVGAESYFPLLNWIIFPVFGLWFGDILQHSRDKAKLYLHLAPVTAALMLCYLGLTIKYGLMFLSGGSYYRIVTIDAIFFCILCILVFSVCYWLSTRLPEKLLSPLRRWSIHINTIYCIHWVFLGLLKMGKQLLWPEQILPFWLGTGMALVLLAVSDTLAAIYKARYGKKIY